MVNLRQIVRVGRDVVEISVPEIKKQMNVLAAVANNPEAVFGEL